MDSKAKRREIMNRMLNMVTDNKVELIEKLADLRTKHITVVLENIYQSHNASAVIRSSDCFGIQDVHVIADKKKYEVNREVAMGAGKWVTTHHYPNQNTATCLKQLKEKGYKIVATSPYATTSLSDLDIHQPVAMVFGTEKDGLSDDAIALADESVRIPMYGFTESFNISVSAALTLNTLREKIMKSDINWKLTEDELIELKIEWCRNILYKGKEVYKQVVQDVNELILD
jgi:tRNA (guanosine-2'-O-)-methyltransferase